MMLRRYTLIFNALPWCILLLVMVRYSSQAPLLDAWRMANMVFEPDGLSLANAWQLHNEHRVFFPKLLMAAIARQTDWNAHYEIALTFICLALIGLLLTRMAATLAPTSVNTPPDKEPTLLFITISVLLCSLTGYENWLWGWQVVFMITHLTVVLSIFFIIQWIKTHSHRPFIGALACAVIATYSTGHGLAIWPVGLIACYFGTQHRGRYAMLWLVVGIAVVAFYFYGYHPPSHHKADFVEKFKENPADFLFNLVLYVASFLGSPLKSGSYHISILFGISGLACWGALAYRYYRSQTMSAAIVLFSLISIYTICVATITGISRLEFGLEQSVSPRYIITSALFWISLSAGLYDCHTKQEKNNSDPIVILMLILTFAIMASVLSMPGLKTFEAELESRKNKLLLSPEAMLSPDFLDHQIEEKYIMPLRNQLQKH